MADSVNWNAIGVKLAQGALGLLPAPLNTIGATLLNQVFPQGNIDWNAIAQQFSTAVQLDLDTSFLDQTSGSIQGILSYMATTYANDKSEGTPGATLIANDLEPQNRACYDLIGKLQQDEYKQSGFANFLVAAGVHITILQEKALVDPNATSPKESGAATTLSELARDYAGYAESVKPLLLQSRLNQIGDIQFNGGQVETKYTVSRWGEYQFTDSATGVTTKESGNDPAGSGNTIAQANQAIETDRAVAVGNALAGFMITVGAQIDSTAFAWLALSANPIPKTS